MVAPRILKDMEGGGHWAVLVAPAFPNARELDMFETAGWVMYNATAIPNGFLGSETDAVVVYFRHASAYGRPAATPAVARPGLLRRFAAWLF